MLTEPLPCSPLGLFSSQPAWACRAVPHSADQIGQSQGPAAKQQRRAVRFDPYLQDDIAPAALRLSIMDGARPRDFADPVPEVNRSRWWAPMQ
jgi:hypothetical protein